jgi:hypothetical protein
MPISAKRKLVAGAAGLAVLAGSGGAYAAGQSGTTAAKPPADRAAEQKAFLDDVAKRLNVTRDQLDTAIKGAAAARIDAAVAAGRLTQAQGEAAKKRLQNGVPLLGPGGLGHKIGPGKFGGGRGAGIDGAAEYLGLSDAELREQLHSGKSLADIAKAENKSLDGLKAAIKTGITARLDEAVKNGRLTEAQKTKVLADLDARIDDLVNRTPREGGPRGPRRWR